MTTGLNFYIKIPGNFNSTVINLLKKIVYVLVIGEINSPSARNDLLIKKKLLGHNIAGNIGFDVQWDVSKHTMCKLSITDCCFGKYFTLTS